MPSHLTRVVFRSIIANKPLLYHGCPYQQALATAQRRPRIAPHNGSRSPTQPPRRTIFNFFKPQRKPKTPELPPGLGKLGELAHMQRVAARPPPPPEILEAFNVFFSQKDKVFEEFDVQIAQNAFVYLQQNPREDGRSWFTKPMLRNVLSKLSKAPDIGGKSHLAFARLLHKDILQMSEADTTEAGVHSKDVSLNQRDDLLRFQRVLCMYGASHEGRDIAVNSFAGPVNLDTSSAKLFDAITSAWTNVLRGFSREGESKELLSTAALLPQLSIPFVQSMQNILVAFCAEKGDLEQTKHWYLQPVIGLKGANHTKPHGNTYAAILKACAIKGDVAFGQRVVASLLKDTPNKSGWDAIFVWSAAIGKGVDEVDRMMNVMVRKNDETRDKDLTSPIVLPDIDTINALVEYSISKEDPYSAERFITLGEKRGILPNARTYTMQMQYRLSVNDLDGARAAYFGLQGAKDERSVKITNQLIRVMCGSKQHHFDDIMAIVDDLHESKSRLEPETIATLSTLHLQRGEVHDAIDLLQVHAHHFTPTQRAVIRDQLFEFLLDRQNSTADAWDTYQIIRQIFYETPRHFRVRIMEEFFERRRSDMACHVFFHMRNETHPAFCADRDVYVSAFTGFGRNADAESLELAHNQLKLDLNVEVDTKIRNSLMLAYAGTGNNRRALEHWAEIVASREGPTYNSIAIAFRSCEGMSFGDRHAKPIWKRLKEMDIDIDKQIFTAYLGAIARNQLHDESVAMLQTAELDYGLKPDLYMLSNWFNATAHIDRQEKVEAWIRQHYPSIWAEIEGLGHVVTMDGFGYRQYNINRDLEP